MEFNKLQKEIINNIEGAYLISAPVGTGKTTVLSERITNAISSGIKPEEILCLTFTNKAAEEMRNRIKTKLNDKEKFDELIISTFHGFCTSFIKQEAKQLGVSSDFLIIDGDEQVEIMNKIIADEPEMSALNNWETFSLIDRLYKYRLNKLQLETGHNIKEVIIDELSLRINDKYLQALQEQNALDFNQLVVITLQALYLNEELKNKWSKKFRFIQLDEFQDTHLSEYLVIKQLAREHKNITFIGDLDQTIYSWRGSEPVIVSKLFKNHFKPVREMHLAINYRFNNNILGAIKSVLNNFENKHTKEIIGHLNLEDSETKQDGDKCIQVFGGYNFDEEVSWVVEEIKKIRKENKKTSIAVLARANSVITNTAEIFAKNNIAHVTVDQYNFFKRQEIKDIYAYMKIIFNKYDLDSAYRIINRPSRGIGDETLKTIQEKGNDIGLKISDFLSFKNYSLLEPYYNLLSSWKEGRIIVLDTETTGTNPLKDEIVQIYAREVINGKVAKEFHFYLKNTLPLGNSTEIHRITEDFLKKNGEDPKTVLNNLKNFIGKDIVVGHNVNFDINMIVFNGKRHNIDFDLKNAYDTLDIARRMVDSGNYKLNTLARMFNLETATHSADDDVMATIGLLEVLVSKLKTGQERRIELFKKFSKRFIRLATLINNWQSIVQEKRPVEALEYILKDSGLLEYYQKDKEAEKRLSSLNTLKTLFEQKDKKEKLPQIALQELINYASLVKNIDFLGLEKGKIPIVTIHQVKGLEFDHVFLLKMNEYTFPSYQSIKSNAIEEEKRLFYVALTRAKESIYLSYSNFDQYNRPQTKSRFIDYIDKEFIK